MHSGLSPSAAYRRVEFDARIAVAGPADLVVLCCQQVTAALGAALAAAERGDAARRSAALTRALAALTALQLGVDPASPLAPALHRLYGAARQAVLGCVPAFDALRLEPVRRDFAELAEALARAR